MRNIKVLSEMVKEYGVRNLFESLTDDALREESKEIFKNQLKKLCIILGIDVTEDEYYNDTIDNISRVFNEFKPVYTMLFSDEYLNMISTPDGKSKHTEYVTKNILLYAVKMMEPSNNFYFVQQEYNFIKLHFALLELSETPLVDTVNKAFRKACNVYEEFALVKYISKESYRENFKFDTYYKFIKNRVKYLFMQAFVDDKFTDNEMSPSKFIGSYYCELEDIAECIGDIIARRDILTYTNDTPGKYANLNCVILDSTDRVYLDEAIGIRTFRSLEEEYRCCISL
jgi:hypothetical protein